jgi:hypothetical protein
MHIRIISKGFKVSFETQGTEGCGKLEIVSLGKNIFCHKILFETVKSEADMSNDNK